MNHLIDRAKNIKVLIIDLDGTLTDGIYQVSQFGKITKSFYTRDFSWIGKLLYEYNDILVCILTNSTDECLSQKYINLPYKDNVHFNISVGIKDKKEFIENNFKTIIDNSNYEYRNISWDEIAYIGDGENDLESMKLSAITGCPQDAEEEIKEESNFVSKYNGGRGAVADFIKYLISLREDKNV